MVWVSLEKVRHCNMLTWPQNTGNLISRDFNVNFSGMDATGPPSRRMP